MARSVHMGRSWRGNELEQECPCPKERCGLVADSKVHPDCPQHAMLAAKTMRQAHYADECPGRPAVVQFAAAVRERAGKLWVRLAMNLGIGAHADGQAQWEPISRLRWAASHYLCIGQWFWDGKDNCHKCGSQPSDIDFLMRRVGFRRAECIDAGECQQFAEEEAAMEDPQ